MKPAMTDPIEINRRSWDECAEIHARDATGDYKLDRLRAGQDTIHPIEAAASAAAARRCCDGDKCLR